MSIELAVEVDNENDCKTAVLAAAKADARYELVPSSETDCVLLRFAAHPRRDSWLEDVTIHFQLGRMIVAFHSGTPDERAALIRSLQAMLRRLGCQGEFIED